MAEAVVRKTRRFNFRGSLIIPYGAFMVLFVCGMRISGRAADTGGRMLAFGITLLMSVQAIVNVAMVTGCAPTKGFPLPFISFGGSSLLMNLFMIGVLLNVADQGSSGAPVRRRR